MSLDEAKTDQWVVVFVRSKDGERDEKGGFISCELFSIVVEADTDKEKRVYV